MPCICYGDIIGDELFDSFLRSEAGQQVMDDLTHAAIIIIKHRIPAECKLNKIEFSKMFVKAFLHMLIGCDEYEKL